MRQVFYFDKESALSYAALRRLAEIDSPKVEDYVHAFSALVQSNFLLQVTSDILGDIGSNRPRLEASCHDKGGWRLLLTERFSLAVHQATQRGSQTSEPTPRSKRFLSTSANDALIGFVGTGEVDIDFYCSASDRDDEVFDKSHSLRLLEQRSVKSGDTFLLRANSDVPAFRRVEGSVVMFEFVLNDARRIVWNYDPDTLRATHASSATVDASRVEFALDLLTKFSGAKSTAGIERIAREHTHHWVRWKAVKALLKLDVGKGIEALRVAADDPHPHVRKAARTTLDNFRSANVVA